MNSVRTLRAVVTHDMRKLLFNWRTAIALIVVTGLIYESAGPIRSLCALHGVRVTPFVLMISLASTPFPSMILLFCFLILICDAPFIDECQPMILLRTGRYRWLIGQLLYILLVAAAYWAYLFLMSIVMLLPCITWSLDWGIVYNSLSVTGEGGMVRFSQEVMYAFTPAQALLLTLGLNCALCVMMGQTMFLINIVTGSYYGVLLPVMMQLLHYFFIGWFVGNRFLYFSPVSFVNLCFLADRNGPSVAYAVTALAILILITAAACLLAIRRRAIVVRKPI